jgi:hypothetical protein
VVTGYDLLFLRDFEVWDIMFMMFGFPTPRTDIQFNSVSQNEDANTLDLESEKYTSSKRYSRNLGSHLFHSLFFLVAVALSAYLGARFGGHRFLSADSFCIGKVSNYCICIG